MSVPPISGLQTALQLCASEKIKERSEGQTRIRGIFSDRDNLKIYQETAKRDGGAGWVALFQCLFQVVIVEKKAWQKKSGTAQAERRLAEAISLVRWMTERTVHQLSQKPFLALFTHMSHILVYDSAIFRPAALDYAKALRCLLSYSPHLDNLDERGWKMLMGIIWSDLLGDPVALDEDWEDTTKFGINPDDLDELEDSDVKPRINSAVSSSTEELVTLIPILLTSPGAPLLPELPTPDTQYTSTRSLGFILCEKIHRFLSLRRTTASVELNILRSLNLVLEALEVNCRVEFVQAGNMLLPQLGALWSSSSRLVREQVLIAVRFFLPYFRSTADPTAEIWLGRDAQSTLLHMADHIPREHSSKWGCSPLDLNVLRLTVEVDAPAKVWDRPFETPVLKAGVGFSHDAAMSWAIMELYADLCTKLPRSNVDIDPLRTDLQICQDSSASVLVPTQRKRRKQSTPFEDLLAGTSMGSARLHHLQILLFVIVRNWSTLTTEERTRITSVCISLFEVDDVHLQNWSFVAMSCIATSDTGDDPVDQSIWQRAWTHASRKCYSNAQARCACNLAAAILVYGRLPQSDTIKDIEMLLRNIDIQCPPTPRDSICNFVSLAVMEAQNDIRLYSAGLEDKVISWIGKWNVSDVLRTKFRLPQQCPADILAVLCRACGVTLPPLPAVTVEENLPDCPIVNRLVEERDTQPIRQYGLYGTVQLRRDQISQTADQAQSAGLGESRELGFLDGRARSISDLAKEWIVRMLDILSISPTPTPSPSDVAIRLSHEKTRYCIDLLLLVGAFQATLRLNSIQPDNACSEAVDAAISKLASTIQDKMHDVQALSLMWYGFRPLLPPVGGDDARVWPVLLRSNTHSGIRSDLLPQEGEDVSTDAATSMLHREMWNNASATASALGDLLDVILVVLPSFDPSSDAIDNSPVNGHSNGDDDFDDIRIAESDAMPLSKEAIECRRIKGSLIDLLIRLRLQGSMFLKGTSSVRDSQLINVLLSAEGPLFILIGRSITRYIKMGILRLSVSAVELFSESLEEMMSSYAYSRDESMALLFEEFLTSTAAIWTSPQASEDLVSRSVYIAKLFVNKNAQDLLLSWRVRLGLILLIDEYLDYDPDMVTWRDYSDHDMDVDVPIPTDVISGSLEDRDMRVRFRGTTSTAGLLYLSSIAPVEHTPFYHNTVSNLPREPRHWDSFLTDLLWKLNCCIASARLRAAAIYHLFEVPVATSTFNNHLQQGLQNVANRLGLSGISDLYLAHSPLIVSSQICAGQDPLLVPHRLCGFESTQEYAAAILESSSSMMLLPAEDVAQATSFSFYTGICEAAGILVDLATSRHLPNIVAKVVTDHSNGSDDLTPAKRLERVEALPGVSGKIISKVKTIADDVICCILELLDSSVPDIITQLDMFNPQSGSNTFAQILPLIDSDGSCLPPSAPVEDVIEAITFLKQMTHVSSSKAVFNALRQLFHDVHKAFLVSEQRRRVKAIALVTTMYIGEMRNPSILGLFLQEAIPLLSLSDLSPTAFSMLQWGFGQLTHAVKPPGNLHLLFSRLGLAYSEVVANPLIDDEVKSQLKTWIRDQSRSWADISNLKSAWIDAQTVWSADILIDRPYDSPLSFDMLAQQVAHADPTTLPRFNRPLLVALNGVSKPDPRHFGNTLIWSLKDGLAFANSEERTDFLELLYQTQGAVHPPELPPFPSVRPSGRTSKEDPTNALRASIIQKIVQYTSRPKEIERFVTTQALRYLRPHVSDLRTGPHLVQDIKDLLSLLSPLDTPVSNLKTVLNLRDRTRWIPLSQQPTSWISELAKTLVQSIEYHRDFFSALFILLQAMPHVANELLPYLVHASLLDPHMLSSAQNDPNILATFFTYHLASSATHLDIVQAIINVVLHLRNHHPPSRSGRVDELGFETWLSLDCILLSEAAARTGAYATSLMFLEMLRSGKGVLQPVNLYDPRIQTIMYEIYSNVEDPDGFYAIKTRDVGEALQRRLDHEGDHWRAFGLHSANVEAASNMSNNALAASRDLHMLGLDQIAGLIMQTQTNNGSVAQSLTFDLAWRTSNWNLPVASTQDSHSLLYSALRVVHRERRLDVAKSLVGDAIKEELVRLSGLGPQRMTKVHNTVTNLLCLREISTWLPKDGSPVDLQKMPHIATGFSFDNMEKLVAVRRSLIAAEREREKAMMLGDLRTTRMDQLVDLERDCLLHVSRIARANQKIQAANNAVTVIRHLEEGTLSREGEDEFEHVLWSQNEHALSIQHLEQRIEALGGHGKDSAVLQGRLAKWTSIAKYRTPEDIRKMFDDARRLGEVHKVSPAEQAELCRDFAVFADAHQQLLGRSPELEQLPTYIERKGAELQSSTSTTLNSRRTSKSSNKSHAQVQKEREIEEDKDTIKALLDARKLYVKTALQMYAKCLTLSDEFDDLTTRMISLWLEHDTDDDVSDVFSDHLKRVPTHKFIFLGPQLAARLDRSRTKLSFNDILNNLMLRLSREHPFHILYQVITLAEGFSAPPKSRRVSDGGAEGRAPAAASILADLQAGKVELAKTAASQMKAFADGSVSWCLMRTGEEEKANVGKQLALPSSFPLKGLTLLDIPVCTAPPAIDPTCRYQDIVKLSRFRSSYTILGGLHRPKKMQVYDSVHSIHRQIYKGEDEVRQDAVMEQVFDMSNKLLSRDGETRARNLRFRTYTVIPLAQNTGIMEFVGASMGIGDWLKPAHHKYGKVTHDIPADDFRKTIKPKQEAEKDWATIPRLYTEMMQKFRPVMRYFFTEIHRDPLAWFTMRLNYTRSAAVTSMLGWMLGIGDRHCSNILIDKITGELVHIDFGIVFEDGQRLRIPEKVPFRLTNDIVDGFGIAGVDGTYRRCSEHTLRVLRHSSQLIMTVLEVFKHDPLYAWDADPDKLQRAQGGGRVNASFSASAVERADRILSKIQQKLRDDLSIEYRVNELIQEARSTENLAKIFVGWQPWF